MVKTGYLLQQAIVRDRFVSQWIEKCFFRLKVWWVYVLFIIKEKKYILVAEKG